MLSEYKQLYRDSISDENILSMDKNELIMKYVETKNEEYLSAAIYKFWYILNNKLYNHKNNKFVEKEDMYEIFIESIMETCEHALWNNPNHSLYNDKKAPEKSINKIFNSRIINHFHACNRQKRKSIYEKVSLTNFNPKQNNDYYNNIEDTVRNEELKSFIVDFFMKKDYYSSYILDMIVNNNVFNDNKDNKIIDFNRKKLKHVLMSMDDEYCNYFSKHYSIPLDKVKNSMKYIDGMSYDFVDKKISISLNRLMRSEGLKDYLDRR